MCICEDRCTVINRLRLYVSDVRDLCHTPRSIYLHEDGPSLVEPEVLPAAVGHQVAGPAVMVLACELCDTKMLILGFCAYTVK